MPFVADDALSATAAHIDEMRLFGYRPQTDEEDPRPSPTDERIAGAAADIFNALVATFLDTSSEPDLEALLWSEVNLFHRAIVRVEALLDANELAQKTSQSEQDGSELRSVELERLLVAGAALIERRNVLEQFRDIACDLYARRLGAQWRPRSGSLTHQRRLTASMIDSRDYLAARRTATLAPLLPPGPRIAFTGGGDCNDHRTIWDCLDRAHARHGAHPWRRAEGRGGDCGMLGPHPRRRSNRVQARLDTSCQGRPLQTQRCAVGGAPRRSHRFSWIRRQCKPCRQSAQAWHPDLEMRRRVSANRFIHALAAHRSLNARRARKRIERCMKTVLNAAPMAHGHFNLA